MSGPLAAPGSSPFTSDDSDWANKVLDDVRAAWPKEIKGEYTIGKTLDGEIHHKITHENGYYEFFERHKAGVPGVFGAHKWAPHKTVMRLKNVLGKDAVVRGELTFTNFKAGSWTTEHDAMEIKLANIVVDIDLPEAVHRKKLELFSENFGTTAYVGNKTHSYKVPISQVKLEKGELGHFTLPYEVSQHFHDAGTSKMPDRVFRGYIAHVDYWDETQHKEPTHVTILEKYPI